MTHEMSIRLEKWKGRPADLNSAMSRDMIAIAIIAAQARADAIEASGGTAAISIFFSVAAEA